VHEDPYAPITTARAGRFVETHGDDAPIAWWPREQRYAERLAPGTKFADIIGEIDPAKILGMDASIRGRTAPRRREPGQRGGAALRAHPAHAPGLFAMNELPDLDDLVQVGLFNILEERDVQIRGYPVSFEIDVWCCSAPTRRRTTARARSSRSSRTASARRSRRTTRQSREAAIEITEQEAARDGLDLGDPSIPATFPVIVPLFMKQVVEEISIHARKSKLRRSGLGRVRRFSIANYKQMVASARQRAIRLGETPAVPRISDLAHFHASEPRASSSST
jgi:magnesium chelatase subunit I